MDVLFQTPLSHNTAIQLDFHFVYSLFYSITFTQIDKIAEINQVELLSKEPYFR